MALSKNFVRTAATWCSSASAARSGFASSATKQMMNNCTRLTSATATMGVKCTQFNAFRVGNKHMFSTTSKPAGLLSSTFFQKSSAVSQPHSSGWTTTNSQMVQKVTNFNAPASRSIPIQINSKKEYLTVLAAGMPQLLPFYFVNEITTAFIVFPVLVYVMSKYVLPRNLRTNLSRLFITKL